MDDMMNSYAHKLTEAAGAFAESDELLSRATAEWFAQHGAKLNAENHCLRVNPVKVSWSPERTRYERTADLVLKEGPRNISEKVLVKSALRFTVEWPNDQEDRSGG